MADANIVVLGIDVLDGASVGTNSSGGAGGEGTVRITGGSQPFEDDDIVVFRAVNVTADNEVNGNSAISDVTVYDSYEDYLNGVVKFDYRPQNPGQTANIQSDISGEGDGYLRFNANVLVPEDGGPSFNQLLIAPGTDLADAASQPGGLDLDRQQDFDFDGNGIIEGIEAGNTLFRAGDYAMPPICFVAGTRIRTPDGQRRVEDLKPGDLVTTRDRGAQPLLWVGRRVVAATRRFAPVRFAPGVLGNRRPLVLSPNHRVVKRGSQVDLYFAEREVLVAAKHLIDGSEVTRHPGGTVDYVHLMFDRHEVIWAEGAPVESLYPGALATGLGGREARDEVLALFPELRNRDMPVAARKVLKPHESALLT